MSYFFSGVPGTGTTACIRALSYEIKRHIHFLNLSTVDSDDQLNKLMSQITYKDTIIVLEDVDAMGEMTWKRKKNIDDNDSDTVFIDNSDEEKERKNDKKKKIKEKDQKKCGVTLSGLLNQLDGIHDNHARITILTTNHPKKLDEALIRDGRIDDRIYFGYATIEQAVGMFLNFYGDEIKNKVIQLKEIDFDNLKIPPCTIENAMKKNPKDHLQAIKYLLENDHSLHFSEENL